MDGTKQTSGFDWAQRFNEVATARLLDPPGGAVALDGHTFLNTASIGSYVDLVDARERLEDRIGKWPAVVVALGGVLRRTRPAELEIEGERRTVWMVFIGNCRYNPLGFAPSWRERLDDGELDVRIVDGTHPWARTRLLLSVLTGRLSTCCAYEQRFVPSLHVKLLGGKGRLARDGETFDGPEEFMITKADEPLLVYGPEP
jgi:diacylglycerol kinase family enzyme